MQRCSEVEYEDLKKERFFVDMGKRSKKVVFKTYTPNQILLLPPSLDEKIAEHHPVRIVSRIIDKINISALEQKYAGGGASSYHPRMLLKVLVYAYLTNIYSSRKIEECVQQNIYFMWLSGMTEPDHNTINRFRGERLRDVLKPIFVQVVNLLAEAGLVSLKDLYTDGTKIEANANRYTFVWGKSIQTNKKKMMQQLEELWNYAQKVAAQEEQEKEPLVFEKVDAQKMQETIAKIDSILSGKEVSSKVKQKLNYARKNWPANLDKYEKQQQVLGERNSYSKTDQDATFMRMKEDHMKNGQLKAGYNLQISTNNQIITNYTLHSNPADTNTLKPHLEEFKKLHNQLPDSITADAGYGSEENYDFLEQKTIEAFVKFGSFDAEQQKNYADKNSFHQNQLHYNKDKDCYYCPMGQKMNKVRTEAQRSENGYEKTLHVYQAQNCTNCPLRSSCHRATGNRIIKVNHRLQQYWEQARQKLKSEEGIRRRKKRCYDVEPVFAQIKHNKHFKRFNLRGIKKVEIETGLLAIAHNLMKMKMAA